MSKHNEVKMDTDKKYVECKETFEKYVAPLIAKRLIPPAPKEPTPSGWIPPNPELNKKWPYFVERSKNHMLPVYYEERNKKFAERTLGNRQLTVINSVRGDINALAEELRVLLNEKSEFGRIPVQADGATLKIRIDGVFLDEVANFLLNKGF
ncbi:54S ribosomal protein L49, mitochondrial [Cichlidogyrus casuarinus]|uniref:Large ribosomal subunit protein mL49 n=1 Tax=Cichlidogyrus casuarinus TaxID=1844966 RepID=A0ABD2Q903_9PLAT